MYGMGVINGLYLCVGKPREELNGFAHQRYILTGHVATEWSNNIKVVATCQTKAKLAIG